MTLFYVADAQNYMGTLTASMIIITPWNTQTVVLTTLVNFVHIQNEKLVL